MWTLNIDNPGLARLRATDLLAEAAGQAVLERQLLLDREAVLRDGANHPIAVADDDLGDDEVARLHGAVLLGDDLAVTGQQPPPGVGDVVGVEGLDRAFELHAAVVGQFELGANLHLELVNQRPLVRDLD